MGRGVLGVAGPERDKNTEGLGGGMGLGVAEDEGGEVCCRAETSFRRGVKD